MKGSSFLKYFITLLLSTFGILHTYLLSVEFYSRIMSNTLDENEFIFVIIFTNVMRLSLYFVGIFGTYLNSKKWTEFFGLLDILDKSIKGEKHGLFYWIILNTLLILYIIASCKLLAVMNLPILEFYAFQIFCKLQHILITLVIWQISTLVCSKYKNLTSSISLHYKNKIIMQTCGHSLTNLHRMAMKFNEIFEKLIFVQFIFVFSKVIIWSYYILISEFHERQVMEVISTLISLVSTCIIQDC